MRGLAKLQCLELSGTQIGDEGLTHLKGLSSLSIVSVRRTRVTDAGIADLQKALPGLRIVR